MQKAQAQNLVKETLQNDFDKERFIYFVKNLLNKVDDSKAFHAHGYVPEEYKTFVKTYERLATYTDPTGSKIDILVVYLQKETSLERARTAQRNFVARYLKDRDQKDAGLIAFVSPDPADWRFSLVKMEYKFTEGKSGKVKVKEEFTPAKRWSFLVGTNENSHTAQSRLAPIVEDDQTNPTLKQHEDAFNIGKVTKEFFEKYRELFLRVYETLTDVIKKHPDIKADFEEKNVNIVNFSKKLLGQIVFLYFLQKKGWFGVPMNKSWGNGDKKFLRTLFEEAANKEKNYFNDYLEPLFYEALAKERDDDFYSRFECKIPFLNGGLFDPISNYDWVNTVIDLPDDIFSNTRKTKDGDTGDGILDIFDRYNFTVKEDEPLEKEVAVDPEMLGKVFENLLEVKDRKSKGTYYTPREIVHYMCEQSLVNYLATELEDKVSKEDVEKLIKSGENVVEHEAVSISKEDNPDYGGDYKRLLPDSIKEFAGEIDSKLATIKVCDPAIGSGAFPVGMMNAIVKARMVISSYLKDKNRTLYSFKRDCIQNSLYGVDIDPGAVEIAKLRLWLSLVVDEDNIKQIKPLPNLDYKIMQGNSLLEEFEGIKLFDEKLIAVIDTGKEKQLEALKQKQAIFQKEYFELHSQNKLTPAKQAELNSELKKLQTQAKKLNQSVKVNVENAGLFDMYSDAKKKADDLKCLHKEFFEVTQKTKKDHIKKQIEQLEWELIEATLKEQGRTSALKKLDEFKRSNTKPFFLWKLNFPDVFEEKGGFDVVIANPPYINIEKLDPNLKEYLFKHYETCSGRTDIYIAFIEMTLKVLLCNKGNLVFIIPYAFTNQKYGTKLRKLLVENYYVKEILDTSEYLIFDNAVVRNIVLQVAKAKVDSRTTIKHTSSQEDFISNRFKSFLVYQQDFLNLKDYRFETKNLSHATILKDKLLDNSQKLADICFVAYGARLNHKTKLIKKDDYIFSKFTPNLKPYNEGKNIERYRLSQYGWLEYKPKEHYNPMFTELFENEKIVTINVVKDRLRFAFDTYNFYNSHTTINIVKWHLLQGVAHISIKRNSTSDKVETSKKYNYLFILAILNSKLINWYFVNFLSEKLHFYPEDAKNLPIKNVATKEQEPLVVLVEKILKITKTDDYLKNTEKQAKARDIELQIDELVYKLYGLTNEEIKIVEAKN